jgi:hypothetical protein
MIVLTTDQRSPAWIVARLGRLTGSRAADMMATVKSGEAAGRRNLRVQLVLERLTGVSQESGYVSRDMQYGLDREADAFGAYEAVTGSLAQRVGFCAHDDLPAGCSLDGQVDDFAGILEVKCRRSANHLAFLKTGEIPGDARWQILHNLWISGAAWCDYVSFDDRFPAPLRLKIARIAPEVATLAAYEQAVRVFLDEVDRELETVTALCAAPETGVAA